VAKQFVTRFCRAVDAGNEWMGKIVAWVFLFLVVISMIEVILRYFFDHPTIWAWDVNVQLLGSLTILGGGYTFLHDSHVRVDALRMRLSERKRGVLDLITSSFFFLGMGVLLWIAASEALSSIQTRERYSSYWGPPIYPFKMIIVLGVFLLVLQGIARVMRDVLIVLGSKRGEP
jgi:TRAP-type mannitol/chloroaromatic compound transport system permease small subunit